jgi:hypothetical protein
MAYLVDRLRDLVRRAFLARLCVASMELWPFEGSSSVDAALADEEKRRLWRETWRTKLASITGSEQAAGAVSPGTNLFASRDTKTPDN